MKGYRFFFNSIILAVYWLLSGNLNGQEHMLAGDSLFLQTGYMVIINDTVLRFTRDTLVIIPHGSAYKIKKDREYRSDNFYDNFKAKSEEHRLVKELYDILIKEQQDSMVYEFGEKTENSNPEYEGRIVGKIDILTVDIIEGNVNDQSQKADNFYSLTLNNLHTDTRHAIIRRNLTIKEGERLGLYTISDNEYFLRSLNYIENARIYVTPDSLNQDVLNLLVVVKDIFPFTFGLGIGGIDDYTLNFGNINTFGTGHVGVDLYTSSQKSMKEYRVSKPDLLSY